MYTTYILKSILRVHFSQNKIAKGTFYINMEYFFKFFFPSTTFDIAGFILMVCIYLPLDIFICRCIHSQLQSSQQLINQTSVKRFTSSLFVLIYIILTTIIHLGQYPLCTSKWGNQKLFLNKNRCVVKLDTFLILKLTEPNHLGLFRK